MIISCYSFTLDSYHNTPRKGDSGRLLKSSSSTFRLPARHNFWLINENRFSTWSCMKTLRKQIDKALPGSVINSSGRFLCHMRSSIQLWNQEHCSRLTLPGHISLSHPHSLSLLLCSGFSRNMRGKQMKAPESFLPDFHRDLRSHITLFGTLLGGGSGGPFASDLGVEHGGVFALQNDFQIWNEWISNAETMWTWHFLIARENPFCLPLDSAFWLRKLSYFSASFSARNRTANRQSISHPPPDWHSDLLNLSQSRGRGLPYTSAEAERGAKKFVNKMPSEPFQPSS